MDTDLYVLLRKPDSKGTALMALNIPWSSIADQGASKERIDELPKRNVNNLMFYVGSLGIVRASRRAVDGERSIMRIIHFIRMIEIEFGTWTGGEDGGGDLGHRCGV